MKVITAKNKVFMANELTQIIETRKQLEKREKELKEYFKLELSECKNAVVGEYLVCLTEKSRKSLDKKALKELLQDDLCKYEKTTSYIQLEIKKA